MKLGGWYLGFGRQHSIKKIVAVETGSHLHVGMIRGVGSGLTRCSGMDRGPVLLLVIGAGICFQVAVSYTHPCSDGPNSQGTIYMMREYCFNNVPMNFTEARELCTNKFNASLAQFNIVTMYFEIADVIQMPDEYWIDVDCVPLDSFANYSAFINVTMDSTSSSGVKGVIQYAHTSLKKSSICRKAVDTKLEVYLKTELNRILDTLTVNKNDTSKRLRKLTSMPDDRRSARMVGTISACVICVMVGIMFSLDTPSLIRKCVKECTKKDNRHSTRRRRRPSASPMLSKC